MMKDITEFIVYCWPETDAGLPEHLQLAYHAGCGVKGNRVIVPVEIRETIYYRDYMDPILVCQK